MLPPMSLVVILFAGLFATISMPKSFPTVVYSVTNPVANTTNTDSTGQSPGLHSKEISDKIKRVYFKRHSQQIKGGNCHRLYRSRRTKVYSFGIYQKITTFRLRGTPFST